MASSKSTYKTMDANEAVASVAYRLSEVIAIYPITPSSPMAESCDEWATKKMPNLWNNIPTIEQLQSEGGVSGAVHGSLLAGALTTTFTASQGLLLMIPNMYKIAGELLPFTMHVTARALATNALSIFGDHSDVMGCRQTGFAMLNSTSGQEAQDLALVAHASSLRSSVPFMHFFDGFRTSHEVSKIRTISDDEIRAVIDESSIAAFRSRAISPERPNVHGTAQNPDVYFQGREAVNKYYEALPGIVQDTMDKFAAATGRQYHLYDYYGAPDADRVIVSMGSSCETIEETIDALNAQGAKLGLVKVRLFLPFLAEAFLKAIPATAKSIAVLDRTKEPGSIGEPLLLSVFAAYAESGTPMPRVIGGRYGIGSKEFNPGMVKAIYDELAKDSPKKRFTIGIHDDVTKTSLDWDNSFDIEPDSVKRAVFVGLGADGTVGANKNSIKIIGEQTPNFAQGYFVYDSKKSGASTVSHLRFGPKPIRSAYLIKKANFVACSQYVFIGRQPILEYAMPGATILLNSPFAPEETWKRFSKEWQTEIIEKKLKVFVIDASRVAAESGMKGRTNTVMQACFFALANILPKDEAIAQIKKSIEKTYAKKGEEVVQMNFKAVDNSLANLHEVVVPACVDADAKPQVLPEYKGAPEFFKRVQAMMIANKGDLIPTSMMPADGAFPSGTTRYEKRDLADAIPVWNPELCIQCNKCVTICPHAAIRSKFYPADLKASAPETFKGVPFKAKEFPNSLFTIQVAPEDCTGCTICTHVCPGKDRNDPTRKALMMAPQPPLRESEAKNWEFFMNLPDPDRTKLGANIKDTMFMTPLMEFSGACSACGETPYIKMMTQLFGDRAYIANATGCSSIYGGNLPTTPYSINKDGRGPAWANSLFEDNAEFGLGLRYAVDKKTEIARQALGELAGVVGEDLAKALLENPQKSEADIAAQREKVAELNKKLDAAGTPEAARLRSVSEFLVKRNVWIIGGDGWAYDIGYGGLDHALASGKNIKVLVLDTEVYSNTGGQMSKSTSIGAVAKFASSGKKQPKKDLAQIAVQYGNVYVARVSLGYKDSQVLQAMKEAEAYDGPALIICYAHCIAHGYRNLADGVEHQKMAVESGYWPIFRYNPANIALGKNPFTLDCPVPKTPVIDFMNNETRFKGLQRANPAHAAELYAKAQEVVTTRYHYYQESKKAYEPAKPEAPKA
ncbi:MAG: pyruvate:ferredoxin (flavodoxin) oxidoreductase [Opitutae bacterium]|nr:pyruvate:ferredoxin (flavodoxin) oxidoreductase [Opitutae bacterium]